MALIYHGRFDEEFFFWKNCCLNENQVRSGSGFGKIITFAIRNKKTDFGPNLIEPDWMLCTNPEKIHFLAQKNQVRSGSGQIRCEKIWHGATLSIDLRGGEGAAQGLQSLDFDTCSQTSCDQNKKYKKYKNKHFFLGSGWFSVVLSTK